MKMRELEQRTGVNRETIRYYIREGLLPEPERPKRNVARYTEAHVAKLTIVKQLQGERFLPLDMIKRVLKGDVAGLPSAATAFPHLAEMLARRFEFADADTAVPLSSLTKRYSWGAKEAKALDKLGIIRINSKRGKACVGHLDGQILALWLQGRAGGFGDELGYGPNDIVPYANAAKSVAKTEVGRFYSRLGGRLAEGAAAARAQHGLETMNALFGVLRIKAVLAELERRSASAAKKAKA